MKLHQEFRVQEKRRILTRGSHLLFHQMHLLLFCLGDHSSADCSVVTEGKKKKSILMRMFLLLEERAPCQRVLQQEALQQVQ